MKVLLCGKDGKLGTKLLQTKPKSVQLISVNSKQLDISCKFAVTKFLSNSQIDLILNCAAITDVEQAQINPNLAFKVNAFGAANLASHNIPLIHVSTDYVFAGNQLKPYTEKDPTGAINHYGLSKLVGENLILKLNPQSIAYILAVWQIWQ